MYFIDTMRIIFLLQFLFCSLIRITNNSIEQNIIRYHLSSHNDSIFFDSVYWKNIKEKDKWRTNEEFIQDSLEHVKWVKGSYTEKDADEYLLFKQIHGLKSSLFIPLLIMKKNGNAFKLMNYLYVTNFDTIDCNNDGITDLILIDELYGNGCNYEYYSIVTLNDNIIDTLFYSKSYEDCFNGPMSYKIGDTVFIKKKYNFEKNNENLNNILIENFTFMINKQYFANRDSMVYTQGQKITKYYLNKRKYIILK